jgi:hypothetical protein
VLVGYCSTSIYAALNCRGLYADASYYLLKIAETEHFHFYDPARETVQILRQAPVVILRRLTNLGLFELGQAFSLSMLLLPIVLCPLCWPILPQERKSWIIFPVLSLLAGVSASNFAAIGEGALAASYLWPLLFLLLFRVEHLAFQIAFLLLCIPALFLHEAAFSFMLVFLFACAGKYLAASTRGERIFLGISATMFLCIIAYEIRWIIHPVDAVNRNGYIVGLRQLAFVVAGDRWNLPLLTGAIALVVLAFSAVLRLECTNRIASAGTLVVTVIFVAWALCSVIIPWVTDATFSPFPQYMARNHALFIGSALAVAAVVALQQKISQQIWLRPTTLFVIASLACAQLSWDLAATNRWRFYISDVSSRLGRSEGLISWEQALALGDADKNRSWQAMGFGWTMPGFSVVLQSDTPVRSLIAAPKGMSFQPFDPSNIDKLPQIRGVDYTAYVHTMKVRQSLLE